MVVTSAYSRVHLPDASLPDYCLEAFERFRDRVEIEVWPEDDSVFTYADVIRRVKSLTVGLERHGVRYGHIIGTIVSNCPEFILLSLAAHRLGAIITTCNPAYTTEEILAQFSDCRVDFILTQEDQLPKVNSIRLELPSVQEIFLVKSSAVSGKTVASLMTFGEATAKPTPKLDVDKDLAFILYSSGTTGLPKGVMISHKSIVCNNMLVTRAEESRYLKMFMFKPDDVVLSAFPFFHVGGFMTTLMALIRGATYLIMPRYEPTAFLNLIQRHKATALIIPPPIVVFLAKSPLVDQFDLATVRSVFTGAAPVPVETARQLNRRLRLKSLVQVYGMTESGPITHMIPETALGQRKVAAGSCGVLVPNIDCKVVAPESGRECGANDDGELWVRSPSVMSGYLRKPAATAATITPDGWLKTGDIGHYDEDGYFYIVDRLKELIKVRGFQVAPAELEALLLTHADVAEALVIGVPHAVSGELPRAYVVLKDGHSATEAQLQRHVEGHVASYKRLAAGVRFVADLPKTASGKLLRRHLRDKVRAEMAASKL